MDEPTLLEVIANLPQLTSLSASGVVTPTACHRLPELHGLESLKIAAEWKSLAPSDVLQPATQLQHLTSLSLHNVECGDKDAEFIATNFPQLTALDIRYSPYHDYFIEAKVRLHDSGVESLARGLKQLRSLNISGHEMLTGDSLRSVAQNCPLLTSLNLYRCRKLGDDDVEQLVAVSNLECLDLRECPVTRQVMEHVSKLQTLRCFDLSFTFVEDVAEALKLESLPLTSFSAVGTEFSDRTLEVVGCSLSSSITTLELGWCDLVTDAGLQSIKNCVHLTNLDLNGCRRVTAKCLGEVLKRFKNLQQLAIFRVDIRDDFLKNLALSNPLLTHLSFGNSKQVTDVGLARIAKNFFCLEHLSMNRCPRTTNAGVIEIAHGLSGTLKSLHLINCDEIGDESLLTICALLQSIDELHLRGIDANKQLQCTDAGFVNIRNLKQVKKLDIRCCGLITDSTMKLLSELPKLVTLGVRGCPKITDHGKDLLSEHVEII